MTKIMMAFLVATALSVSTAHSQNYEMGKSAYFDRDYKTAFTIFYALAQKGEIRSLFEVGNMYENGLGVQKNSINAVEWYMKAVGAGHVRAAYRLGRMYMKGRGVRKDYGAAFTLLERAAKQGDADASFFLSGLYYRGRGISRDYILAAAWIYVAGALTRNSLKLKIITHRLHSYLDKMTKRESERAHKQAIVIYSKIRGEKGEFQINGSGFFVDLDGHAITNAHVLVSCLKIGISGSGIPANDPLPTKVVAVDWENDLALIKAPNGGLARATLSGRMHAKLGERVVVLGFPLYSELRTGLNVTTGIVSAETGRNHDEGLFQITAPVQPGNSGGPILDMSGNIVGVVVSKVSNFRAENIGFGIRVSVLRKFLNDQKISLDVSKENAESLTVEQISDTGKKFSAAIHCWR